MGITGIIDRVRTWLDAQPEPSNVCHWCGTPVPGQSWCSDEHEKAFDEYESRLL